MAEVIPIFALNYVIPVELVLEATMLRFLDMVFQFLVIFLFLCLNRNPTFGFLVVVLLHLLSLLPIPWLPVGASSLLPAYRGYRRNISACHNDGRARCLQFDPVDLDLVLWGPVSPWKSGG